MFCRTVVRISSEPSQCHSIAVSGVPVCMVPNAKYEILEFGSHMKGGCWSNRICLSSFSSDADSLRTTTFRELLLRMVNCDPCLVHSASPHGTDVNGFASSAIRLASSSCSTCARSASADSRAASSCDLNVAFISSTRRTSASYFSRAAFAFLESFTAVATHPTMVMKSETAKLTTVRVADSVHSHGPVFIDSSPNCSARTSHMRDNTDFRRGSAPNAVRHHTRKGGV
ncbi:hypothetical protein BPORC_1832 [Bifidobacterium porcinum]|nr:hypothetical protein BPORC_1832 [Bifidobacterium porcinum]